MRNSQIEIEEDSYQPSESLFSNCLQFGPVSEVKLEEIYLPSSPIQNSQRHPKLEPSLRSSCVSQRSRISSKPKPKAPALVAFWPQPSIQIPELQWLELAYTQGIRELHYEEDVDLDEVLYEKKAQIESCGKEEPKELLPLYEYQRCKMEGLIKIKDRIRVITGSAGQVKLEMVEEQLSSIAELEEEQVKNKQPKKIKKIFKKSSQPFRLQKCLLSQKPLEPRRPVQPQKHFEIQIDPKPPSPVIQTTLPTNYRSSSFNFPCSLSIGQAFANRQAISSHIQSQAFKMANTTYPSLFHYYMQPNGSNCKWIYVKCRLCSARITFGREPETNQFVVKKIDNQHKHNLKIMMNDKQHQVIMLLRQRLSQGKSKLDKEVRNQAMQKFGISSQKFHNIKNIWKTVELKSYAHLENFLKSKQFQTLCQWSPNPTQPYPELIVTVSPLMKQAYKQYGEFLSFTIIPNMIRQCDLICRRYYLGVFTCYDTNCRVLLAGIAFTCGQSQSLEKVFEKFIQIHKGKVPETIRTDDDQNIFEAIERLKKTKKFSGSHILEKKSVLEKFRVSLTGNNEVNKNKVMKIAQKLLNQYGDDCYKLMRELASYTDYDIEANQLFDRCERLFPVSFDQGFTCLLPSHDTLIDELKSSITHETTMMHLCQFFAEFDVQLWEQSDSSSEFFERRIEDQFKDERIKPVRVAIEANPFMRFLEHYTDSLNFCKAVLTESKTKASVTDSRNGDNFELNLKNHYSSMCICLIYSKTGLPCIHLLSYARIEKNVDYLDLINKRWLKKIKTNQITNVQIEKVVKQERNEE